MEFKFRGIHDRTAPNRSSPSPSSQSSSYSSDDQALRGNYSMDPNLLNNPSHFYTIQREIEKQIIRHEIITREIVAAEIERRLGMGFGHDVLPPTLPHFSHGLWGGLNVNKKDKLIMLGQPDSIICESKQKAATPPAGSGELPSTSSNKPKEWSCALCQFSATTKRGLDVHLQGKNHKAKAAGLLRQKKMCSHSTSTSKKSTESRGGAGKKMKTEVQEESVKANKTVIGLNQKLKSGLNERLPGKKHKAKVAGSLRDKKMCSNSTSPMSKKSTESRGGAGQNMKLQVKKHKAKVAGLLRDKKMCSNSTSSTSKKSTESRGGAGQNMKLQVKKHKAKVAGLLRDKKMCSNSTSSTSKKSTESRGGAAPKMKLQGRKHKAKVAGLLRDKKMCSNSIPSMSKKSTESRGGAGQKGKLQGKKHKAKVAGLLRDKKMCSNSTSSTSKQSTESRGGAGQKMKTKVQEESVKANKTVVGSNQKVKGVRDEHPQGKKHRVKEELLGAPKWTKKSTESRDSAGQEMKTKVEEKSVKANKHVFGLEQKEEGGQALQFKPYPNLCGSKQEAATLPADSGTLRLTSSKKPMHWSCALCQVSATSKRDLDVHLQGKKHKAKEEGLLGDQKMYSNSTSKNSSESRDCAGQEMKTKVEDESVKANKTVVGLDQKMEGGRALQVKPNSNLCGSNQKAATPPAGSGALPSTSSSKSNEWSCALHQVSAITERGLDERLQDEKRKAKVAGLLRDKKMCSNSTSSMSKISAESRGGAGQKMKTKVQEESVKANKTVVGLNQKVKGGLDGHPQGKKHKVKEEILGAPKWTKKSTESRDSAGQEMKTKVEEKSVKANKHVFGLEQKEEGGQALQFKPYPNLCGSKQEAATLPADSGTLRLTSSKKPMHWSCALCQVSATSKRDLDVHLHGKKHKAKEAGLLEDQKMCSNSTSKNSSESRDSAGQEIKATVEKESVKANKTVVGLDQKLAGGQDEHLQGKKHKAKEAELLGPQKMCTASSSSTSKESGKTIKLTESRDSASQEMKAKVEEESVKAIETVVGLDQKVGREDDSENKNEEWPKKKGLNANTQKTTNGIPTGETMKRKLSPRENFEFWCEGCQIGTHSAVVMEGHKRGKKHIARYNESKKNDEAVPLTTSTTIEIPSEPTEKVEDEDVVAEESNEETADSVIEKAEDEEVVVYRGRRWA